MIKLERDNLQKFCRTCLSYFQSTEISAESANHYNIRETPDMTKLLIIFTTWNINEDSDSIYPQQLCKKCYDKLQEFKCFREMAIKSGEMLRGIVENTDGVLISENVQAEKSLNMKIDVTNEVNFDNYFEASQTQLSDYFNSVHEDEVEQDALKLNENKEIKFESVISEDSLNTWENQTDIAPDVSMEEGDDTASTSRAAAKRKLRSDPGNIPHFCCAFDSCGAVFSTNNSWKRHWKECHNAVYPAFEVLPSVDKCENNWSSGHNRRVYGSRGGIPLLFNGKYFKIIKRINETNHQKSANGIIALCQLCGDNKTIRGSLRITSNFLQHLKCKHNSDYQEYIRGKAVQKPTYEDKQLVYEDQQMAFDANILQFIVDTHSSLFLVEHPSFVKLFQGSGFCICKRKGIVDVLDTKYDLMKAKLREILKKAPYVCTTADIWSNKGIAFFGYTCHWINSDLERQSAALAFCRYDQSINNIADIIQRLNTDFGVIEGNVVCTITNNESNFFKTFQEFEIKSNYEPRGLYNHSDDDMEFESEPLASYSSLSKHYRCGSHSLNLLATTDFIRELKGDLYLYELHTRSLERCSSIWNKCIYPQDLLVIKNILSCHIKTPTATRSNSIYDSLKSLLQHKDKLETLFVNLNLVKLTPTEIEYLEDYCALMQPICNALDFLQDNKNMFYGYFLPTLISTKVKLRKLHEFGRLKYLNNIAKRMELLLVERFRNFFELAPDCIDSAIAAISCPDIKTSFLKPLKATAPDFSEEQICARFFEYAKDLEHEINSEVYKSETIISMHSHSFFDFDEDSQQSREMSNVQKEFRQYLNDDNITLKNLQRYPVIKKMFLKFNAPLPSSAPVEHLFRYAGIVNGKRRPNLSDEYFERIVMLKANKMI